MYIRLLFTIELKSDRYRRKECSKSRKNYGIIHELIEQETQESKKQS